MKKIIYNIVIVSAASCLFAFCEDDNYDEPNSDIKGRSIDTGTSEVVPIPVQDTSSIQIRMHECDRYCSMGDDCSQLPIITCPKIDGTYENSWMFSKQYILMLEQTNFYLVDTMVADLNVGGLTDQDIKVIPYARIDTNNAVFENKKLKVSYTITRSKDDYKIENAFLVWYISPYIDKTSGNLEELVTVDHTNVSDKDILNTVLTQEIGLNGSASFNNKDEQAIMKGNENKMYIRVGVTTNGKINYSEVVPVDISL